MQIAIISDIHSNLPALEKTLEIITKFKIETIYCLGDIVGYGAQPNECVDLVREHVTHCVLGNHDLAVINREQSKYLPRDGKKAIEWTSTVLSEKNFQYISNLPYTFENDIVRIVHANPEAPEFWKYVDDLDTASTMFQYFNTPFCFIGHTHVPTLLCEDLKTFSIKQGKKYLINVGSVGQPRDGNPRLSFGILDLDSSKYDNVRVDYDIDKAAEAIFKNKLPKFLAARLYSGI